MQFVKITRDKFPALKLWDLVQYLQGGYFIPKIMTKEPSILGSPNH